MGSMNKLIIYMIMCILLSSFTFAVLPDAKNCYSLDTGYADSGVGVRSDLIVFHGSPTAIGGKVGGAYYFDNNDGVYNTTLDSPETIQSFIYQHWFVAEHLANSIRVAENKKYLVVDPPIIATKIKKKKHDGFNVLYYFPSITKNIKFKKWLYGFDIFEYTREQLFPQLNYIVVDGSQNMTEIYPIVDFYLRPTRHDGHSRMIDECQINNIPYYQGRTLHYIIQVLNESIRNNNSI